MYTRFGTELRIYTPHTHIDSFNLTVNNVLQNFIYHVFVLSGIIYPIPFIVFYLYICRIPFIDEYDELFHISGFRRSSNV